MNIKVLTAVFITLFGISVGMSQGALSIDDLTNVSNVTDSVGDTISPIFDRGDGSGPTDNTGDMAANRSFAGTFSTGSTVSTSIDSPVQLSFDGEATISIGGLQTDMSKAQLVNFTGDIDLGENASVGGEVDELTVDDSTFTADDRQAVSMEIATLNSLTIKEFVSRSLTFENVTGAFETDSGSFTYDEEQTLAVNSFEGTLTVSDGEIELDGVVKAASIGDMTLGG